jgi:PncC family amidohydrolase
MNFPSEITTGITAIRGDQTHGASWLSREAMRTVGRLAELSDASDNASLLGEIRKCSAALAETRPEMAPIRHWLERLDRAIDAVGRESHDVRALRVAIGDAAVKLIAQAETANRRAAENAVALLPAGSTVFTASYSQTVVDACRLAERAGKLRRLLIAESVDPSGHRYGRLLAEAVGDAVPDDEVIADDRAPERVRDADRIWLGADTVLPDGSVLNGTPSLAIARAGHAANRPVELVGESAKIQFPTEETIQPTQDLPPGPAGMERVPGDYITAMITEDGVVPWPLRPPVPHSHSHEIESGKGTFLTLTLSQGERGPDGSRFDNSAQPGTPEHSPLPLGEGQGEGGSGAVELVAQVAEQLMARRELLAVVESGCGGRICDLLTNRPGSSAWFAGGVVAYSGTSTRDLVGVSAETLREHGAVSRETALGLAEGAIRLFGATWGIGETGIAGPQTGRRSSKPAGLAYLAVAGPDNRRQALEINTGLDDRAANKEAFALAALRLLLSELER